MDERRDRYLPGDKLELGYRTTSNCTEWLCTVLEGSQLKKGKLEDPETMKDLTIHVPPAAAEYPRKCLEAPFKRPEDICGCG